MYRGAMQAILSELARASRLLVVEELILDAPKTKILVKKLKELSLEKATIVVDRVDENLLLSARNIKGVEVVEISDINPISLVGAEKVLFTLAAIKKAEELFS
jgi:large subunit ribosomal protein L4